MKRQQRQTGEWLGSVGLAISSFALGLVISGVAVAEKMAPTAEHRRVTQVVTRLMQRDHISRHPIDDEISTRTFTNFLEQLDPMKIYFQKSDIDELSKYKTQIDDYVNAGDTSFAFIAFDRFIKRVDERTAEVDDLLAQPQDYTLDEKLYTDFDTLDWPDGEEAARDLWRRRIKYELLVSKADEKPLEEAKQEISRRYNSWAKRKHQIDENELIELFLTAVTTSFDPHTVYMSRESLANFEISMRLNLDGIGAELQFKDGYTTVSKVVPGGAADKQGELQPEDRIVSVGQGGEGEGEMEDVVDMKLSDVVKLIRGKAGTLVRLGIQSKGSTQTKEILITRARIQLTDNEARSEIVEHGQHSDGRPIKVGVIDLPSFYMDMDAARRMVPNFKSTTRDVRRILEDFRQANVDVCVLDLRRNGGGSLTEAINLTGLFIDQGPVLQVKDADGRVQQHDDHEPGMAWTGPLVVVTSRFSASASEILAGAIQDYRRGLIVGDSATHGKGTVQNVQDLGSKLFRSPNPPQLGALKVTMQQFYLPDGSSTQQRGVLSDIVLPWITDEMEGISESDLDYAIEFDQVEPALFEKDYRVTKEMIGKLTAQSEARRNKSEDFQKLERNIAKYREQRARKYVILNEAEFMKERAEIDAEKEDEKTIEDQLVRSDHPVVQDTFYFKEVLDISADAVRFEEEKHVAITP